MKNLAAQHLVNESIQKPRKKQTFNLKSDALCLTYYLQSQ